MRDMACEVVPKPYKETEHRPFSLLSDTPVNHVLFIRQSGGGVTQAGRRKGAGKVRS